MASKGIIALALAWFCILTYVMSYYADNVSLKWSGWESPSAKASYMHDHGGLPERKMKRAYEGIPIEFPLKDRRSMGREDDISHSYETTSPSDQRHSKLQVRRIFNVNDLASIEDNKFMAALLVNKQLWCGAIIIDSDKVLTAAHCLQLQYKNRFIREYTKMLLVRIGSNNATGGGEVYKVSRIMFHPKYKPETLEFNVALLQLQQNINFEKERKAEKIKYSKDKKELANKNVTFLGWGSRGVNGTGAVLQTVKLPVSNLTSCQEVYGRRLVTSSNFCAEFKTLPNNVCNHDAGGPAILDGVLVGILSFSAQRCDVMEKPAVFTNVGSIADWLEQAKNSTMKALKRKKYLAHRRQLQKQRRNKTRKTKNKTKI